ncbi:MAG: HAD family hydrolase [Candidatus Thermoplasmatota archaeon]|nr:HAD family hydrolase [Candidatus Thermoplasmatota archaeon]
MSSERAIFLDFSNTITTVESENISIYKWLDLLSSRYHIATDIRSAFSKRRLEKLIDREKNFRTFMEINHEVLSELYGISEIYEEEYYEFHEKNLKLRPDFIDFVNSAKDSFQIVMVTDADNVYTERTVSALGIKEYFDSIVTAESVRAPKPDPVIFKAALREANNPSNVIFIGDSERRDIEGAKRMKFFTLKMEDTPAPTLADRVVHCFNDVTNIINDGNLF